MIHTFAGVKFKQDVNLQRALDLTRNAMCTDKELPVRVEAAIAVQMLLNEQDKVIDMLRPHVKPVILGEFFYQPFQSLCYGIGMQFLTCLHIVYMY